MANPLRARRQLLQDWQSAGLTHLPLAAHPADVADQLETVAPPATPAPTEDLAMPRKPTKTLQTMGDRKTHAKSSSNAADRLAEVARCVAACTRCPELARTRRQTVFGVGNPQAEVMFVGEAPGADEDRQGEPFVGRAGQLLNRIIEACGFRREEIYICNILRCRPPDNRTPSEEEAANCREFLDAQIEIVDPDFIVCWGSCAAQNLLNVRDPIGKMRQRFFTHGRARVLCTYHPSYLLRNPSAKKPVWDDMKLLLAEMGRPVP